MHSFLRRLGVAAAAAAGICSAEAIAGDAANGKTAYVKNGCFQCHGFVGQGGAAGKLAPNPMPYEAFANYVRTTNRAMPPYSEQILPDNELADIYSYVESIPASPDYKSTPLLNQ
jgi:ubiquinol-cytochrome c reductase cytochrome c subunit